MKKRATFSLAFIVISVMAFGQIKVNNAGKAFFGTGATTTSYGAINLTADGVSNGLSFNASSSTNRFSIFRTSDNRGYITWGGLSRNGMYMNNLGRVFFGDNGGLGDGYGDAVVNIFSRTSMGLNVWSYQAGHALRVVAHPNRSLILGYLAEGAQGHELTLNITSMGEVYARGGYLQLSDGTEKTDMKSLNGALAKIEALNPISFNYKDIKEKKLKALASAENETTDLSTDSLSLLGKATPQTRAQMKAELSRPHIGLVAQEVEKIVPEVVRTIENGKKGIMYSDLVALLIQGVKELKEQQEADKNTIEQQQTYISELNERMEQLENPTLTENAFKNKKQDNNSQLKEDTFLSQNTPNPFNKETEIAYRIPETSTASICIYNLNGMQLKKYPLDSKPTGTITISASEFPAGIYIYSLIVNNQEMNSKRMVLTD